MNTDTILKLHDIEGLREAGIWPLALGWWPVIFLSLIFIFSIGYIVFSKLKIYFSWKKEVLDCLLKMEKTLNDSNKHEVVTELSELIKRIMVHIYPRNQCAGLEGNEWLLWLEAKDPKNFKWSIKGKMLVDAPYMPSLAFKEPSDKIRVLIKAIKCWVN